MRAMLSIRMGRLKATELAVRISRYLAFAMIVIGIFYSFSLVLVGIFVLIAGFMEWMEVRRSYAFPGSWPVHDPLSPGSPWESDQRGSGTSSTRKCSQLEPLVRRLELGVVLGLLVELPS